MNYAIGRKKGKRERREGGWEGERNKQENLIQGQNLQGTVTIFFKNAH